MPVTLIGDEGVIKTTVEELLPYSFSSQDLHVHYYGYQHMADNI